MGKLTKAQIEVLTLVSEGKVHQSKTGYGACRIFGAQPSVVGRLRSMAFIEMPLFKECVAALTDAGRQALSEGEQQ